jgi:hypothetical protein
VELKAKGKNDDEDFTIVAAISFSAAAGACFRQPREPEPSTINEKTIADFTRVGEQMGILERDDVKEAAN